MLPTHPLDLPEILRNVACYMPRHRLVACLRVCKSWHQALIPLVWKDILHTDRPCPLAVVQRHCHLIRTLQTYFTFPQEYTALTFPRLESLDFSYGFQHPYPAFIFKHPMLTCLTLHGVQVDPQSMFWEGFLDLENLKDLTLVNMAIGRNDINTFWRLCTQLERLHFRLLTFAHKGDLSSMTFPLVQMVRSCDIAVDYALFTLEFIQRCPNMTSFCLNGGRRSGSEPTLSEFVQLVSAGTWPKLHHIDSWQQAISNDDITLIVESMKRISALFFIHSNMAFGPNTMDRLRPHFLHLKKLLMAQDVGLTSSMAQQVLASCPFLEILAVYWIDGTDVVAGGPWVCTGLKQLSGCFRFNPDTIHQVQPLVFEQLSKLTRLEELSVCGRFCASTGGFPGFQESVDLRLEYGLGKLSTLRSLRYIDFTDTEQKIGEQEIEWIAEHWKSLSEVKGILNMWDTILDEKLEKQLLQCGIHIAWCWE